MALGRDDRDTGRWGDFFFSCCDRNLGVYFSGRVPEFAFGVGSEVSCNLRRGYVRNPRNVPHSARCAEPGVGMREYNCLWKSGWDYFYLTAAV